VLNLCNGYFQISFKKGNVLPNSASDIAFSAQLANLGGL